MRAFCLTEYGGPDAAELREVPQPRPGPGELPIRGRAAGLNPVDLAGTVAACGGGVTGFAAADRVFARVAKETMGAFADYVVVTASLVARMPGVDWRRSRGQARCRCPEMPSAGRGTMRAAR